LEGQRLLEPTRSGNNWVSRGYHKTKKTGGGEDVRTNCQIDGGENETRKAAKKKKIAGKQRGRGAGGTNLRTVIALMRPW